MKFTVSLLLIIVLSFVACLYFPWWSISIVAFLVVVLIPLKPGLSFLAGFLALLFLWAGLALWIGFANNFVFVEKMSMLILKINNSGLLITLTASIGGLVGGFGALSGAYFRRLFQNRAPIPAHDHQL